MAKAKKGTASSVKVSKTAEAAQKRLGERMRRLREKKKMSQARLGERAKLSPKYISLLELGHRAPSFDKQIDIANDGLEISVSELMYGIDRPIHAAVPRLETMFAGLPMSKQDAVARIVELAMSLADDGK